MGLGKSRNVDGFGASLSSLALLILQKRNQIKLDNFEIEREKEDVPGSQLLILPLLFQRINEVLFIPDSSATLH